MKVSITGRHMDITDALKTYTEAKVGKLEKYLPSGAEAVVTMWVEKYRHKVEVQIKVNGILIQAQEETAEMYASIDRTLDKIGRQVKKYKDRLKRRKGRGEAPQPRRGPEQGPEEGPAERIPAIIKTKRFDMKPMSAEEAVMQMELLDKDFFVFSNIASGDLSVIYKRRDGNVGLIEPLTTG